MSPNNRLYRRQFLASSAGVGAAVAVSAAAPQALLQAAASAPKHGERVLVVVELSGGNDGLNTVVPFQNADYRKARPKLAIPKEDVLKLNQDLGLHPALKGFAKLWEQQQLTIVQGVGYEQPNRSHFESMDIWHSCQRKSATRTTGWLGRYLDQAYGSVDGADVRGLHLGDKKQPFALTANKLRPPSIRSLDQFKLDQSKGKEAIQSLSKIARPEANGLLQFVDATNAAAISASQRVETAIRKTKNLGKFPSTGLGKKLEVVARLIAAEFDTRLYYVALDGFDTHAQQAAAHAGLLREVGDALASFTDTLKQVGQDKRVVTMVFSEFGRRVQENASEGTDHGAAAPMFTIGPKCRGGIVGELPSLTDLADGDLKYHTDFRRVYAALIRDWLQADAKAIVGSQYAPLDGLFS